MVIPLSSLLDWFKGVLGGYGLSILVVTFLVRLAIFPLFLKQQRSTKAMQEVQPQINKIREKYKGDSQKIQMKTMEVFKEHGVNPMAGCMPMLIQLPVMFAFYQAIMFNPHIAAAHFLYMKLGAPDPYYILPFLAALTTYIQFIVTGTGDNPQMKIMIWAMPAMIFFMAMNFPSALSLYWVYGNVITIMQYVLFVKNTPQNVKQEGARR
jgi:YidC/Oxa1 family membrane protein insertase